MDFSKINDRDQAEAGAFCHFCHPDPDSPMFDGDKPVGAMVRGMEAFSVRKALTRISSKGITGQAAGIALVKALVVNFVNVERAGSPLTTSDDDIAWLLDRSSVFERQIIETASALGNAPNT